MILEVFYMILIDFWTIFVGFHIILPPVINQNPGLLRRPVDSLDVCIHTRGALEN